MNANFLAKKYKIESGIALMKFLKGMEVEKKRGVQGSVARELSLKNLSENINYYDNELYGKGAEIIKGGKADKVTVKQIADKYGVSENVVNKQIQRGIKVEMEHTKDKRIAREIALDHIFGEGLKYYVELAKMERKLKNNSIEKELDEKANGWRNGFMSICRSVIVICFNNNPKHNKNYKEAVNLKLIQETFLKEKPENINPHEVYQDYYTRDFLKVHIPTLKASLNHKEKPIYVFSQDKLIYKKDTTEIMKNGSEIKTTDGKAGGEFGGKSHAQGGVKAVVVDDGRPVEVEAKEIIINKNSAQNPNFKHDFDGKEMTNKEILDRINREGGGVAIMERGGVAENDNCGCGCSMEVGGGIEKIPSENFIDSYLKWYDIDKRKKMNIYFSFAQYYNNPISLSYKNNVILDLFEKIDQNIDAKKYMDDIIKMADESGVNIYLEAMPRYKYFRDNTEKREKITPEYLKDYYKKFGFVEVKNNDMIRYAKGNEYKEEVYKKGVQIENKNLKKDNMLLFHVSNKKQLNPENAIHVSTDLETAEKRADVYNYGNDAIYYFTNYPVNAKIYKTTDKVANLIEKKINGIFLEQGLIDDDIDTNFIAKYKLPNERFSEIPMHLSKQEFEDFNKLINDYSDYDLIEYENDVEGGKCFVMVNSDKIKFEEYNKERYKGGGGIETGEGDLMKWNYAKEYIQQDFFKLPYGKTGTDAIFKKFVKNHSGIENYLMNPRGIVFTMQDVKDRFYEIHAQKFVGKWYKENTHIDDFMKIISVELERLRINPNEIKHYISNEIQKQTNEQANEKMEIDKNIVNNPNSDYNKKVPIANRYVSLPKKVAIQFTPYDKNLESILDIFASNDDMRPVMAGAFWDSANKEIACTDAHKLIKFYNVEHKFDGIYPVKMQSKQKLFGAIELKDGKIQGNYPKYNAVIPEYPQYTAQLDVRKLLAYCEQLIRTELISKATYQFIISYKKELIIGLNCRFTIDICNAILKLGFENVEIGVEAANKAITYKASNDDYSLLVLQMPIMLEDKDINNTWIGDIDYSRGISCVYDISDNRLYSNEFKYVDDIDLSVKKGEVEEFTKTQLAVIKKFTNFNHTLPILESVQVKNGVLTVSDLENSVSISGVKKQNGYYKVYGNSLLPDEYRNEKDDVDDYPKIPNDLQYYKKIGSFDALELREKMSIAYNHVSNDELRPTTKAIVLFNYNGQTYICGTDSKSIYFDVMETGTLELKDEDEKDCILINKGIIKSMPLLENGFVDVYLKEGNVIFLNENTNICSRLVDGNSPAKRFLVGNFLSMESVYMNCIDVDRKELKKFVDESGRLARKDKSFNYAVDISERNKAELYKYENNYGNNEEVVIEKTGLTMPIIISQDTGRIQNGIIIMSVLLKGGIGNKMLALGLLTDRAKDGDDETVTICEVEGEDPSTKNMYWTPAPKIIGLTITKEKKKAIAKEYKEAESIAKVEDEKAYEPIEEIKGDGIDDKLETYKLRLELILEMAKESSPIDDIQHLIDRADLLKEMIADIEKDMVQDERAIYHKDMTLEQLEKKSSEYDKIIKEREDYIRKSNTPLAGYNSGIATLAQDEFNEYSSINDEIARRKREDIDTVKKRVQEKRSKKKELEYYKNILRNIEKYPNYIKKNVEKVISELEQGNIEEEKPEEESSKLLKLKQKLSELQSKLFDAKLKDNQRFKNMGWGSGMRKGKLGNADTHEKKVQEKIDKVEAQIKELENK